jgi:hypothetical protein
LLRICGCKDSTIFHKAKQLVRFLLGQIIKKTGNNRNFVF